MKRQHAVVAVHFDQIGIERMVVRVQQQRGDGTGFFVRLPDAAEIHVHHGIAVHHHKTVGEQIGPGQDGSGGAERLLFQHMPDADAKFLTVAKMLFDQVGAIMDEKNEVGETMLPGQFHLMFQQRLAGHGNHRLGEVAQPCAQSGAGAAGQDDQLAGHYELLISATISATARSTA